jgi:predicted DNA-binding helix-hairpin-helix protein
LTRIEIKFYNVFMDAINILAESSQFMAVEAAEDTSQTGNAVSGVLAGCSDSRRERVAIVKDALPIYQAAISGGKRIPLLKTVLTSACERNCNYCAFRAGRDFHRFTMSPDELAQAFMNLWQGGAVEGLFLSSGVAGGGIHTQDRLLDAAEILRTKLSFRGYLHLKLMPGAEFAQVERTMQLADRVSINLEAPTADTLQKVAPQKILLEELLKPLRWVEQIRQTQSPQKGWQGRWPSSSTQFVVGAGGETDLELLRAADYLHNHLRLARVYFSAFHPVPGTPFEDQPPVTVQRKIRLYQAAFLLRDYGFHCEDLPVFKDGSLPLAVDPKMAWAESHLSQQPVDVNRASLHDLIRIPGIGQQSARAIVAARRQSPLRRLEDLSALGISARRAAPFILLNGMRPPFQLPLRLS